MAALLGGVAVAAPDRFPEPRPSTRAEAVELICTDAVDASICLRSRIRQLEHSPAAPAVRRALELLSRGMDYATVQEFPTALGIPIRYTTDVGAFDRVAEAPAGNPPQIVEATASALEHAHDLLVRSMELPEPSIGQIVLVELGDRLDGYPVRTGRAPTTLVLDATPGDGAIGARRAAIRQFAYATAVGLGPSMPAGWAEAFAEWTVLSLEGPDSSSMALLSRRLERMEDGLLADNPRLQAGNALWFAFVEGMYGRNAVRVTLQELAVSQSSVPLGLDRAMRRTSRHDLTSALREFHLWSVLTGTRADEDHFPFAAELEFPGFAAMATGLPALSVHRAPPLGPLGATQIRLAPEFDRGGLRLRFEGDLSVRWEVDLLLIDRQKSIYRLPLPLSTEGRGEITVPLDGVQEALLLVRNLEGSDRTRYRYTYSAQHERLFPLVLTEFDATRGQQPDSGVVISWQTTLERDLVGFNILRRRVDGTAESVVNPVWIPALGVPTEGTSYQFVDRSAQPDVGYLYRVQAITTSGLSSYTDRVVASASDPAH